MQRLRDELGKCAAERGPAKREYTVTGRRGVGDQGEGVGGLMYVEVQRSQWGFWIFFWSVEVWQIIKPIKYLIYALGSSLCLVVRD